ncbi:Calcium-transporting ATPase 12, plasma membrane-type [Camellia lanceoleosa]|uniref:Calcium-transporting ATPase 12, plasma membrane-type n=1 Tax=Camellia lanceoleosa TaxID=1840588 RepID=A0ACC0HK92_9ERIC|nr:Calcium-transporting ATPase 12, plasma membrane-type [Camellia lanceoleosa]
MRRGCTDVDSDPNWNTIFGDVIPYFGKIVYVGRVSNDLCDLGEVFIVPEPCSLCVCTKRIQTRSFSRARPSCVVVDVEPDYFPSINESSNVLIDVDFPSIDQSSISKLVRKTNTTQLAQFGGVEGVVAKLKTNAENGIKGDVDGIASRRNILGSNSYRKPPAKTLHVVMDAIAEAFKDPLILILLVCAALSLGFGVHKDGLKGCSDGAITFIAVFLVIAVSASIKKQLNKSSQGSSDIWVDATRNGQQQQIPIFNVVVGDVVSLKIGDQVPADGLFLDGHSLKVDVSSITAKSYPLEEVDQIFNPFLLSGTKVIDGDARMLVTSVGMNTEWGQTMSKINYDFDEKTPLQAKQKILALFIGMVGMLFAFLVLVILLIRYFTGNMHGGNGSREFTGGKKNIHDLFKAVVGILATPVATAATAFPEGFLLAAKVTFAYSIKRMLANQALVRNLSASEAMGSITAICTDKRGTLTMNQMKVTMFWVGPKYIGESASSSIYPSVRELLCQGVGLNETQYPSGSLSELAEKAIHDWGVESMCMNIEELRKSCDIIYDEAFNFKKTQSVLIRKKADQTIHLHHKGSPEVILAMWSHYYDATGNILVISNRAREKLWQVIQRMVTTGCQCIAFAHKQLSQENYLDENYTRMLEEDCSILLGLVGLKDPCRPSARQAVIDCQSLGVNIKMITADDLSTAEAIAIECGIIDLNQGIATGEVVDGEEFRNWTDDERMEKANRIRVIARASHLHKLLMVQCLKQEGHVVAVTGDSTKDATAFREARVGISMGIQSADMANVSLDVVILNNDFDSVVKVLRCGRGIYINFQAFTQVQLTVSIVSLVFDFVTAISASEPPTINIVAAISTGKVSYASLQLLWVKLVMGTLAALATTIEQPTTSVMRKPLINRTEPFITNIMWKDILTQALCQITILLTIQFQGESVFNVNAKVKDTMAFNTLVLFQIFTIFNARKFERNIVEGIQRKKLFLGIIVIIIVFQVAMVELLKTFAHLERLSWGQWGTCFGIAAVPWFIGWLSSTYQFLKKHLWGAMGQMVDLMAFLYGVLVSFYQGLCGAMLAFLYGVLVSFYRGLGGDRAITNETSGEFEFALLTILQCAHNPAKYFAKVFIQS